MLNKIFVYGSLNNPSNKYSKILIDNSEYLGDAEVKGQLFFLGRYPGLIIDDSSSSPIKGKLYRINDKKILSKIDEYEDFKDTLPSESLFIRKATIVKDINGKNHRAWVYEYNRPTEGKKLIRSGDYKRFMRNRKAS